ncbi:PREDICTED: putative receptor-like protein kinase At5g39000 [Tarenaya hassleriana]|uniref:putative receptor-like protein kinase At5g39000 n=1 Tax=Tarenaya hassleriana TaxID=28532 RepID=UPI00053C7243|nr:PREDICTED: putative receptor-like protein kinase At5g39000 [Tarenaya hassleriana]
MSSSSSSSTPQSHSDEISTNFPCMTSEQIVHGGQRLSRDLPDPWSLVYKPSSYLLPPFVSTMISKSLIVVVLLIAAVSGGDAASYNATDLLLVNCGATGSNIADQSGRIWSAEDRRLLSANSNGSSFPATASVQEPSVEQVPYMTARIFRSDFRYSFPVSPGWKFVRLYFYPTRYGSDFDAVNSYFAVTVNGFSLMRNFSASLTAAGSVTPSKSIVKEFIIPVLNGQTLNLTFAPSANSLAFVNGIEIVSMPDGLYTKGGFDDVITNVDSSVAFEIDNTTAFETVYRVNVGGKAVTALGDTGMFRRWDSDNDGYFIGPNSGQTPYLPDVRINYTSKTPAYVAPEEVYTTYRTMGNAQNPLLNLNFNLTWIFTVDVGFNYLVRLHFCETMLEVTKRGQRVFSIFITNRSVVLDADVINWSGGSKIPVYRDFATLMGSNGGEKRRDLQLDLHPFMEVKPEYADAILNGVEILKLSNTDGNIAGPNPEPIPSPEPEPRSRPVKRRGNGRSHVLVIILAVVGCVLGLSIIMVTAMLFTCRRQRKRKNYGADTTSKPKDSMDPISYTTLSTTTKSSSTLPSDLCRRFSISEIRSATDDFDEKLIIGVGGFGNVYKGRIDGGSITVAIKRLGTSSHQGIREFETELNLLSKLRHVHLVSLIGYCDDENEMIIVYEYMPRGTLRYHLYKNDILYKNDRNTESPMPWKQRLEICIGAAHGLNYLHTGAKHSIIHRDIKSTNILLDDNYVAKVSDFGLSKVGPTSVSQTHVTTVVKGSMGYLDPEYYRRQVLTDKSDVYSFGVVLFEVLCGRPARMPGLDADQMDVTRWAKLNHSRGTVDQIVDPYLTGDITRVSLDKFCDIAVRCVHDRGTERPTMNDVVWALQFALQLHETATKNGNEDEVDTMVMTEQTNYSMSRGDMGTTDEGDDLFSRTTGHVSESTGTDETSLLRYEGTSGSNSGAVFSEIKDPKGR